MDFYDNILDNDNQEIEGIQFDLISNFKIIDYGIGFGIDFHKPLKKYVSKLSTYGKVRTLGYFSSVEEAFYVYKREKEKHIKEVANKWKDQIDPKVYAALMKYQVEITD